MRYSNCERIVKLQKKIVRITSLSKYNAHTEPIFKLLKLLKVKDILKLHELKFYFKYKNNKLPWYIYNLPFVQNADIHNTIDTHSLQGFSKYNKIKILESYNKDCTIQNCYICSRKL